MTPVEYVLLSALLVSIGWQTFREMRFQRTIMLVTHKAQKDTATFLSEMQDKYLKAQKDLESMAFIDQKERSAWLDMSIERYRRQVEQPTPEDIAKQQEYDAEMREEQEMVDEMRRVVRRA